MITINTKTVRNLGEKEKRQLAELINAYNYHEARNLTKERYYEGRVTVGEVNLGIALPRMVAGLVIGCEWGAKAVDVLAARSMFDGFVGTNGAEIDKISGIVADNNLIAEYPKGCREELKLGACFATLSRDSELPNKCRIRFHSEKSASALWDGAKQRISCGMAIIDSVKDESQIPAWQPSRINLYTDTATWVLTKSGNIWTAEENPHRMGRPLMEPMVWNATALKPFGRSRLKGPVRSLIQGYIRTVANATIGLEFSTAPQKYLLGVTDDQYDTIIDDKFKQYVGNILAATSNPETGEKPTFGQLQQGTISPHVEMLRILSTQFSAATGLTVTDTGVINDANPTSSDAILAQTQTLVKMAEELNQSNGNALRTIALMALAISENTTIDELTDEQKSIVAHFKNPAMPSIAVTADAAIKIASAREAFASTDAFLEMIGFDQADIRRIKAQEQISRGLSLLDEIADEEAGEPVNETNS